jgi:DNA-binding transcriptional regulator LsrR (DeoR family)
MDKIDVAFAGIGAIDPNSIDPAQNSRLSMTGLLSMVSSTIQKDLAGEGATADVSYCLIDKNGIGRPEWQFFLTAGHYSKFPGIKFYQEMVCQRKPVVVVAGPHKIEAIRAALKAQAFNYWVTDEDSAHHIAEGS